MLEIFDGVPTDPDSSQIAAWPMNATEPLLIDSGEGDDAFVVDLPIGTSGPIGGMQVDAGTDVNTLEVRGGNVRIDSVATGGVLNTTVSGGAELITSRLSQTALAILGAGTRVTLLPGGGTSRLTSLSFGTGSDTAAAPSPIGDPSAAALSAAGSGDDATGVIISSPEFGAPSTSEVFAATIADLQVSAVLNDATEESVTATNVLTPAVTSSARLPLPNQNESPSALDSAYLTTRRSASLRELPSDESELIDLLANAIVSEMGMASGERLSDSRLGCSRRAQVAPWAQGLWNWEG
jgi:hypothetical protein